MGQKCTLCQREDTEDQLNIETVHDKIGVTLATPTDDELYIQRQLAAAKPYCQSAFQKPIGYDTEVNDGTAQRSSGLVDAAEVNLDEAQYDAPESPKFGPSATQELRPSFVLTELKDEDPTFEKSEKSTMSMKVSQSLLSRASRWLGMTTSEGPRRSHIFVGTMNAGHAAIGNLGKFVPRLGRLPEQAPEAEVMESYDIIVIGLQEASSSRNPNREPSESSDEEDDLTSTPSRAGIPSIPSQSSCASEGTPKSDPVPDGKLNKVVSTGTVISGESSMIESTASSSSLLARMGSVFSWGSKSGKTDPVVEVIARHLGKAYYLLKVVTRGSMRLMVFVLQDRMAEISEVDVGAKNTGVAGVGSNKGGQMVTFRLRDTTLCFFSCHLAAHQNQTRRRNADAKDILAGCRARYKGIDLPTQVHHSFYVGDMNYRIEPTTDAINMIKDKKERGKAMWRHVQELIVAEDWTSLLNADQLQLEMTKGAVLSGFHALEPTWAPTFKVARGNTDMLYNKKRIPSYTDRILYRSLPGVGHNLTLVSHESCPAVCSSDHKPVRAHFELVDQRLMQRRASGVGSGTLARFSMVGKAMRSSISLSSGSGGGSAKGRRGSIYGKVRSSIFASPTPSCVVEITNLSATKLTSGCTDPYLTFSTVPDKMITVNTKTDVAKKSQNPVWQPVQLMLKAANVAQTHLIIECRNEQDRWTRSDDLIGALPVHLGVAMHETLLIESWPLTANGQVHGYLNATITVVNT